MIKNNLVPFTDADERVLKKLAEQRDRAGTRFPLLGGLLVTFGFVCTLYGFEKLIDKVDLFVNNPWILLATGITVLFVTGAAYKKLN